MRLISLFLFLSTVLAADMVTFGMHPNYDVQLPVSNLNTSGVTVEELEKQSPQYAFAFSGNLIGYFGLLDTNPARLVVWTVRRGPDYEPKDQEGYDAVPVIPPIVPPPVVPPFIPSPVIPPSCEMLGTCPQPPPSQGEVPEPRTQLLFVSGGAILFGARALKKGWR